MEGAPYLWAMSSRAVATWSEATVRPLRYVVFSLRIVLHELSNDMAVPLSDGKVIEDTENRPATARGL
jgi:hypothetical protein